MCVKFVVLFTSHLHQRPTTAPHSPLNRTNLLANMSRLKVNILVPMAGRGSRFATQGYVQPKPLIDVAGKPMISWVVDNVDSTVIDARFIFLVLKEHDLKHDLTPTLKSLKPNVDVVHVDAVTEGAACTALLARKLVDNDTPLFIANSDQFVEWDADAYWTSMAAQLDTSDGDVLCFHIPRAVNDTKWSYAAIDEGGLVTDIQEKKVISENATVGYYYWRRGADFVRLADAMIAKDVRVNGEFYVAPVYNEGVTEGMRFKLSFCDKMWGLGVPHDLTRFLAGYVRPRRAVVRDALPPAVGPMRFIAHRGNMYGADKAQENKPEYIKNALDAGFDVEIDVWYDANTATWFLGHDEPQYTVPFDFLLQDRLWIHCKNGAALRKLCTDARVNCFTHDKDEYTLTSKNHVWIYPDQHLQGPNSVAVMFSDPVALLDTDIFGICADNVGELRRECVARRCSPQAKIELIVFDLDGVLVESKDLHYDALNEAIAHVAGADFIITRPEHETVYDGLSTNQKLRLMTIHKNLPLAMHKPIWVKKQQLTDDMVRDQLKPDEALLDGLRALKAAGYPLAVASNCIKSSVHNILDSIGVLPIVDAYFSNEDVEHAKPAPDIYFKACATFGVDPQSTLVVEDSVKGFEACVRAGCHLFKVDTPADVRAHAILDNVSRINQGVQPVTVVVPLASTNQEYWLDGPESVPSEVPSFLADVNGSPVLEWVVRPLLRSRYDLNFVFIVKQSQLAKFKLDSLLPRIVEFNPVKVVPVHGETLGSLQTVLLARQNINTDGRLLLCTCSNVMQWVPGTSVDDLIDTSSDVAIATVESNDPHCVYVKTSPHDNAAICEVHKKLPVGSQACAGLYFWRSAADFFAAADATSAAEQDRDRSFMLPMACNAAIRRGDAITSVPVQTCWSVRTLADVARFGKAHIAANFDTSMDSIYDDMKARNDVKINKLGFTHDSSLNYVDQKARCFAAYSMCTRNNLTACAPLELVLSKLLSVFEQEHVVYSVAGNKHAALAGVLHFTFMQLIGFNVYPDVSLPADYGCVVQAILTRVLPFPFEIIFDRIILTQGSLLLAGKPTIDLNSIREDVRRALSRIGYPLYEPYKNDIAHATLLRFATGLSAQQEAVLYNLVSRASQNQTLARLKVDGLTISQASWKMQGGELDVPQWYV